MSEAPNIVWKPLPGSQELAISCPCHHILYEGTRGPGKTDAQLMRFRRRVGQGYGIFWRGVIFDREYKMLDDLVLKSKKWFNRFGDGATWLSSGKDYKWIWPGGEELLFRALQKEDDYWNYHGQEFPFIGWNELTKFPTRKLYDDMMSCNRTSFRSEEHTPKDKKGRYKTIDGKPLPELTLEVFATTNPHGPGHNWVKTDFVDAAEPGEVVAITTEVFNPRTQRKEPVTKTQVRIFGSYKENTYLTPEYIAELEKITDKNKRRAWLWGDWDIVAGGALDDVWDKDIHVLPMFAIPASWHVDRSLDWGSSKPFSVGWWAEANGEEAVLPDGRKWCPPAGTLVRVGEWYGTEKLGSNVGLKLGSTEVALGIKRREQEMKLLGLFETDVAPGPADNSIATTDDQSKDSIAVKMAVQGVTWNESNKKPGTRKIGLQLIRDRLQAALNFSKGNTEAGPGLYFMENCRAAISTLPILPRSSTDPDDVDTEAEDHAYDDVRYRVLAGTNRLATSIPLKRNY